MRVKERVIAALVITLEIYIDFFIQTGENDEDCTQEQE